MLKLFCIDLSKYATNCNTVNCIPVGQGFFVVVFFAADTRPFHRRSGLPG